MDIYRKRQEQQGLTGARMLTARLARPTALVYLPFAADVLPPEVLHVDDGESADQSFPLVQRLKGTT